jgi:hypothetical protein
MASTGAVFPNAFQLDKTSSASSEPRPNLPKNLTCYTYVANADALSYQIFNENSDKIITPMCPCSEFAGVSCLQKKQCEAQLTSISLWRLHMTTNKFAIDSHTVVSGQLFEWYRLHYISSPSCLPCPLGAFDNVPRPRFRGVARSYSCLQ